jgi:protein phosphatase
MDFEEHGHLFGKLNFSWGAITDKGIERQENEDAYCIEPEVGLFLVSDGMGGHKGGKLASKVVVEDLPSFIETRLARARSKSHRAMRRILKKSIFQQSQELRREGFSESGYKEMGATIALAMIRRGRAYIANLGDSRIYRFRNNKLVQISKEHSVVSSLLESGTITETEAENHEAEGQITHYAGMEEEAHAHLKSFKLQRGDRLLLCTDGLTDMVDEVVIGGLMGCERSGQEICELLVKKANSAGGHDNITIIVVDCQRS